MLEETRLEKECFRKNEPELACLLLHHEPTVLFYKKITELARVSLLLMVLYILGNKSIFRKKHPNRF